VAKWLADRDWSSGKVAMIGGSYNGTTASMVAARGEDVPELKAIVPIAAISRWYGYAYGNGVRYFLNSEVASDEGFDTPLAFDLGFGKTVAADPMGQRFADTLRARAAECDTVEHTEQGYSRNPDYDRFWERRDYRRHAEDFRAAVLLAHGWQDFNVKQEEGTELWRRLPEDRPGTQRVEGVPFKLMYLTQGSHGGATDGRQWDDLLSDFLAHTLKGEQTGVRSRGPVITQGETSTGVTGFRTLADYPAPSTDPTRLWLREGGRLTGSAAERPHVSSYVEHGTATEEASPGLLFATAPVRERTRLVGSPVLEAQVRVSSPTMHITPVLYDVAPDGSRSVVARGFQHVDYRDGLGEARPATGRWVRVGVRLLPVDHTLARGHRYALAVQSSNTVWGGPGQPRDGRRGRRPAARRVARLLAGAADPALSARPPQVREAAARRASSRARRAATGAAPASPHPGVTTRSGVGSRPTMSSQPSTASVTDPSVAPVGGTTPSATASPASRAVASTS